MSRLLFRMCPLLVFVAACGGSESDDETADETTSTSTSATEVLAIESSTTTETTEAPTTTGAESETTVAGSTTSDGAAGETTATDSETTDETLPASSVTATLDSFYDFPNGGLGGVSLPFGPGEIRVWWYIEGDFYTALYQGLSPDLDACPGNSVQLDTGAFEFVSNAQLGQIDCSPSPTGIENSPDRGVVVCGPLVFYRTLIPADTTGNLFASVEIYDAQMRGIGATSTAATAPGQAAEVDLSPYGC